ncbi:hypothetical protein BH20ACI2_BH20ACI2_17920 [soil metagenome]
MGNLSLVKSLFHLREEQKYTDEILLESWRLAFLRGDLAEITGEPSSGKTSLPLALLSTLTGAGEICAVVDSANSFDPCSAVLAGVELQNLLWVKCEGDIEKAFMSADMLVQAKGFGVVWFNLNGLSQKQLRMVPKTYWYRYRNRIKHTPTIFLVTGSEPVTGSASQRSFTFTRDRAVWSGSGRYKLLREFHLKCGSRKGSGLIKEAPRRELFLVPQPSGTPAGQSVAVQPFPRPLFGEAVPVRIEFDYTEV